jgi:ABC-type sugar transport system ATPase subunit
LRGVTFTVARGTYGVVIGPAGSGKTTLLETIAGVTRPTSGVLRLGGCDVTQVPAESRGVGLVYQHSYLFPHLSVGDNIAYGASDGAEARAVARRFDVERLWERDVQGLSGGERQLVALARAIARRPSILLLDEPFAALDPRRRARVRREVRTIHRERGLTTLHVTHDFGEGRVLGDIAVLLDEGRVLQAGPPGDVFRHPPPAHLAEFLGTDDED